MKGRRRAARRAAVRAGSVASALALCCVAGLPPSVGLTQAVPDAAAALATLAAPASKEVVRASAARPCGTARRAPRRWRHVVWIVIENRGASEVMDPAKAPYLASLSRDCGVALNMRALTHPSLPNYIALALGSTLGVTDSAAPEARPLRARSIFSQLGRSGWTTYAESMPGPCHRQDSGDYAVRHNPATYFVGIAKACQERDLPLPATPRLGARFTLIVPNQINNMHDSDVPTGDLFLSRLMPKLLNSKQYRRGGTAIFITADEDHGTTSNRIATFVIAPSVKPGTANDLEFTHYSLLKTTERMLGLAELRNARSARSMGRAFNLSR